MRAVHGAAELSVRRRDTSMEERMFHCCCCEERGGGGGGEGRTCCCSSALSPLVKKETLLQRMSRVLKVAVLLLLFAALTVQLFFMLRERGHHHQHKKNPGNHLSGISSKQQQIADITKPCAMITAPYGNNTDGKYLRWEHEKGKARCLGGFSYSDGKLVVPRTGMYRVFLQITYESKRECSGELLLSNVVLALMASYNDNMDLLSSSDTVNCKLEQWKKSLHTTGIFYLEANSQLRVKSSNPGLIVNDENQVFFGAEFITELPDIYT